MSSTEINSSMPRVNSIPFDESGQETRWYEDRATLLRDVHVDRGLVALTFGNGEVFRAAPAELCADPTADWSRVRFIEDMCLEVPTARGLIELPGDHLREQLDPAYGRFTSWLYRYHPRSVGRKLARLREARGLTQAALARRAGMPRQNLWQIEDGRREPTVSTLARILGALGAEWADLTISDVEYAQDVATHQIDDTLPDS